MTDWEPATDEEAALRDALRAGDQELYFRILARIDLLLPISEVAAGGRPSAGWGTWTTGGRTHVLAFTSAESMRASLTNHTGSARRVPYHDLAAAWPNQDWWLAINPGLPVEGYLPAWFVAQLARGDVRLPGRTLGARARVEAATRARGTAAPPSREPSEPGPQIPPQRQGAGQFGTGTEGRQAPSTGESIPAASRFQATAAQGIQGRRSLGLPSRPASSGPDAGLPSRPAPSSGPEGGLPSRPAPSGGFEARLPSRPASSGGFEGGLPSRSASSGGFEGGLPSRPAPSSGPDAGLPSRPAPWSGSEGGLPSRPAPSGGAEGLPSRPSSGGFEGGLPSRPAPSAGSDAGGPPIRSRSTSWPSDDAAPAPAAPARSASASASVRSPMPPAPYMPAASTPMTAPPSAPPAAAPPPPAGSAWPAVGAGRASVARPAETGTSRPPMERAGRARVPAHAAPSDSAEEPVREPDFVPANEVEINLLSAATDGQTDTFLSTLLLARVLVPVKAGESTAIAPGQTDFVWRREQVDGQPYVVVFTSPARMEEYLGTGVVAITVKFVQLIRAWPDESWSFAVNPGTPVGATLPGTQIRALAAWAAEVGLSDDPSVEFDKAPSAVTVRPDAARAVVMQKPIAPTQVTYFLERGYDRISGFVHRASEAAHLTTPEQLYAALGLGYPGSPFKPSDDEVYVLRWTAYRPNLYRIPYGGRDEGSMRAMQGWVIERPPFRGNGFAPSESSDVIAEFKVDSARLPHGAQMWRVSRKDGETLVALLDADAPRWRRVSSDPPEAPVSSGGTTGSGGTDDSGVLAGPHEPTGSGEPTGSDGLGGSDALGGSGGTAGLGDQDPADGTGGPDPVNGFDRDLAEDSDDAEHEVRF